LALALDVLARLPQFAVTLFDSGALQRDPSRDGRTLALSLGSVQWLRRLGAWPQQRFEPILEVHISQQPPSGGVLLGSLLGTPEVRIRADREAVPMLGAVLGYGDLVATLQAAWLARSAQGQERAHTRFSTSVTGLKLRASGVELEVNGAVERFDLAVIAEGGVFADQARKPVHHDYRQCAWVGTIELGPDAPVGLACERFTRAGPAALLPLPDRRAALVWCVERDEDPVAGLDDAQRLAVLNTLFPPVVGRLRGISTLKRFELGLNAEHRLVDGRLVRIGNAAQTLHPVAGQGLNLGLRDAGELVRLLQHAGIDAALRRLDWRRGPDRWATILATDFLARSFTWKLPGAASARGLGLAALQRLAPVKSALARQMMFGVR